MDIRILISIILLVFTFYVLGQILDCRLVFNENNNQVLFYQVDNRYALLNGEKRIISKNSILAKPYINDDGYIMLPMQYTVKSLGGTAKWSKKANSSEVKFDEKSYVIRTRKKSYLVDGIPTHYIVEPEIVDAIMYSSIDDLLNITKANCKYYENYIALYKNTFDISLFNKYMNIIDKYKDDQIMLMNRKIFSEYKWAKYPLVAHAMGGIDRKTYTNSYDAFIKNYNQGHRVFEVDLIMTADNELVARHDWMYIWYRDFNQEIPSKYGLNSSVKLSDEVRLSSNDFKKLKIHKNYTGLTFKEILKLMMKYDNIYIITDTKDFEKSKVIKTFNYIIAESKAKDESLLDRIIPQSYNEKMLFTVKELYDFKSIIYTLYQTNDTEEEILDFVVKNNIDAVTMGESRFNPNFQKNLNENGILTYIHTINSPEILKTYLDQGVHGVYTDFLYPDMIKIKSNNGL